jgi:diguanylate cyclase (GGDEF)-like protein
MVRSLAIVVAVLALGFGSAARCIAATDLDARVDEVERLAKSAPWTVSDARNRALQARSGEMTLSQRQRLDFLMLRQRALAGEETEALDGFTRLLGEELPTSLRFQVYSTAISVAANIENWPLAFGWLNDAMAQVADVPGEAPRLLDVASYLYAMVDELDRARDLALRGLHQAEASQNPDLLLLCRLVADVALAEDHAHNHASSEQWRRRQVDDCSRAGDAVFVANGKYGAGKMMAAQGRHEEALEWANESLTEFERAGFPAGAYGSRILIADILIATHGDLDRARALLVQTLDYYHEKKTDFAIAETENLLARLAEMRGDVAGALAHQKAAVMASAAADRSARERHLVYLQIQFDILSKEQQIALLEAEKKLAEAQATANQRRQLLLILGLAGLLITAALLSILLRRSARERQRYRWQSQHDSLTRLYNYQQVRKLGEAAFARSRGDGRPFTAVVIDIDLFKQVNDRYGHAAGDETLRCLGAWIGESAGEGAIAGRSGGDEFTVLLEADMAQAEAMLQRLRARIEPITVFGQTVTFNISAGICQADEGTSTLEQLAHQADQALYQAKHEGRDRVVCAGEPAPTSARGASLVVVGSGIQFGRHASARCLSEIRAAEVVFCLADPFALAMITQSRPDTINLGVHYAPGKDRRQTYREIDAAIMKEVRAGRKVCAVFYGHPGVFADVPHQVIRKARAEGIPARMEPGISAEACLYADLGIDPGRRGVQSMEATHFLFYDRQPDPAGLVLLWQVALSGDLGCSRFQAERAGLQALVDKLLRWYPPGHEVILYEAAQLPIESPRAERLPLRDLPDARYREYTTLVIPPLGELRVEGSAATAHGAAAGLLHEA